MTGPADPPPKLPGEWQLDAEPAEGTPEENRTDGTNRTDGSHETHGSYGSHETHTTHEPPETHQPPPRAPEPDAPPTPEQLIEAMLFVGGHPLTAAVACSAVRGLTPERFLVAVDALSRQYRRQRRPYAIQAREDGFVLAVLPSYRGLRERLFGGPREARLSQPALDVLSVVAYRQPVEKGEVDAIRGTDSGALLRQLVRLGLVAVRHRAESEGRAVRYGTTPRFLQLFNLNSLDDLPRLGDTAQV
jgi:segregation and condensation protein B